MTPGNARSVVSRWFWNYFRSLPVTLPLVALAFGFWWPGLLERVSSLGESGLHQFVNQRASLTSFHSAAYLYWWTLALTLPLCLVWLHIKAKREALHQALREIAGLNLSDGTWDPKKWTLRGGRIRLACGMALGVSLASTALLVAHEPSFCKGCETTSLLGFALVNWGALHAMLMYSYMMGVYLYFWRSIRVSVEGKRTP